MRLITLRGALADVSGPTIVCAQAGNVNTGASDPFREVCQAARERGAWVHVDGAFGLWAGAVPSLRSLLDGVELADSWAVDGHKWLNVPYDSGIAVCAHPDDHAAAMSLAAAYLVRERGASRNGTDWTPESSRRARAFAVWAALRSLGRSGVGEMIVRSCAQARRFADILSAVDGVAVLNEVVLNQVLVRVGDDDERTRETAAALQAGGTTWMGATTWRGRAALRISVSDHATTDHDVRDAAEALLRAASDSGD
jgi:glutamate/tyrosine decarboxylase-like PLP-dependent enzyme